MKRLIISALAAMLFCQGCAGRAVEQAPAFAVPADPAAYLASVRAATGSVTDVSGFAKLRIAAGDKTTTSRNVFFVQRPGRIRIETLGFLSRPALFFTADPVSIQLYAVESNSFFTGRTSAENFSRIIGMPLELSEIVESFLGQPPVHACQGKRITVAALQGQLVFTAVCGNISEQIQVDPQWRRISRYSLSENGRPVYAYGFSQFENIDGVIFPLKIEIYHYNYNTAVTIHFESLSFKPIPGERFSISPPPNAEYHAIEELGSAP